MKMTELPPDDQAAPPPPPADATELRAFLREHRAWRNHRNREEADADAVLFERFVDLGQLMQHVTP